VTVTLHWFLPTNGDSRTDLALDNAVGTSGSRVTERGAARPPDLDYVGLVARAAESLGFTGALTPTSTWCEDAWVMTAALTQRTKHFKFLIAFRPGLQAPTLAAQAAATYQRISGGRLLLNVVAGGDDGEQRRYGDDLGKDARYERAAEYLAIFRRLWTGTALVGSYEEVADRIAEYHALGLDEFILSGYPHLEEAFRFGEGVMPILAERGLLNDPRSLDSDLRVQGAGAGARN
jgi:alkanesulfonate monooxygenase SsuD/methylene tetrahydromethanopterin reductase-like flavin-dependent oxidoreductase (luciferase family)